jgi:internalin A
LLRPTGRAYLRSKRFLREKAEAHINLYEAKLILVGEGEVGKTCLMDALAGEPWQEHPTTHGIEIRPISIDSVGTQEIVLNGWDFGGQRVYRPTHQLFFSSPAVYLVVWKPREGPQQGFVREWIKLIRHREPDAKILVVATHGGPQQRQPDIDRQELWDLFGNETVLDFFHVDSKPDENGQRRGIAELKQAIGHVASKLPEMGRKVPKSFQEARQALAETGETYLPLNDVYDICRQHDMTNTVASLFTIISHRLGHLIHYEHDPALRDIVILKPDWLTAAISFVLDDEVTRQNNGLVSFDHLSFIWNNPGRKEEERYETGLHRIFLRLMERFDLSYRVAGLSSNEVQNPVSLIAQLVPDNRPEDALQAHWVEHQLSGDIERIQICQIVDEQSGQSANAEGLFYQLIVRLHRYSLGRTNYHDSVHWQRGLVLDHEYNGRALLEHRGNDIRITVRAPYPERFLTMLTEEVKYLVESFWEGLRCNVMVPCIIPCGKKSPGTSLFEVEKLIDSKRKNRPEYPCSICNEWQNIDQLLRNAPAANPTAAKELIGNQDLLQELRGMRVLIIDQHQESNERFDQLDAGQRELLSKADEAYAGLMKALTDEAKDGPRLFSFYPVDSSRFNPKSWTKTKFRLMLWCEHSRRPGVYA